MFKNALLLITLSALIGSTTPPFAKYALNGLGPFTLLCVRFISASLVLWFVVPKKERSIEVFNKLKVTSLLGAGNPLLFFVGLTTIPASIVPLFFATSPTLTALHAKLFGHTEISYRKVLGIILGLLGVSILTIATFESSPDTQWWGIVLLTLAVFSFTGYAIRSDKHLKRQEVSPMSLVLYFSITGALIALPFALFEVLNGSAFAETLTVWHVVAGVFTGAVGTGIGYLFYQHALKLSDALTASIFFYIQPVFSIILALLLLGESFGSASIIGGLIVLFGAGLAQTKNKK